MRITRLSGRFWKLLSAGFVSNVGDGLALVAFPWLAVSVTDNPMLVAGVTLAARLPWLLFALPAGVLLDRVDRRRAMVVSNILRAVIAGAVAALVATDRMTLPMAYLALLVLGCAEVIYDNAILTIVPAVVRKDQLDRANGWMHAVQNLGNDFVGAPVAGLLVAAGLFLPFAAQSVAAAVSAALLVVIGGTYLAGARHADAVGPAEPAVGGPVTGATADPGPPPGFFAQSAAGIRWLWRQPVLKFSAVTAGLLGATGSAALAVYVLFAKEIVGLGPVGYGITLTAGGAGMVAGTRVAGWAADRLGRVRVLQLMLFGHAMVFTAGAVTSNVYVITAVLFGWGLFGAVWNVLTLSLRQMLIPDALLGRVAATYRLFGGGGSALGVALGSVMVAVVEATTTRNLGLRTPFLLAGVFCLAAAVIAVRSIDESSVQVGDATARQPAEPVSGS